MHKRYERGVEATWSIHFHWLPRQKLWHLRAVGGERTPLMGIQAKTTGALTPEDMALVLRAVRDALESRLPFDVE